MNSMLGILKNLSDHLIQSKKYQLLLVGIVSLICSSHAAACSATLGSTGVVYNSIQTAFNASANVDTITVNGLGGVCNENVFFNNSRLRIILTGVNNAAISGSGTTYTIDARSKGIGISNISVFGGGGIAIQRNANAIIDRVTVQSSAGDGILVQELAFAVIINSLIQNNSRHGIFIQAQASANIGFNTGSDPLAQGNTIQNNLSSGISVFGGSQARIANNLISANSTNGVDVGFASAALINGNAINSNGLSGLTIQGSSSVQLSPSGAALNVTTALNGRFGISCAEGAYIGGIYGLNSPTPLNGALGPFGDPTNTPGFAVGCVTALAP